MKKEILIAGGGASGMMAAITAAEQGAKVTIYEKKDRIGKKILVTGNGKCNLTNRNLLPDFYYTDKPEKLKGCFQKFDAEDTLLFFKNCGLLLKDKNGYIYPACEQASVVLDVLRNKIKQLGIRVKTECQTLRFQKDKTGFLVENGKEQQHFDAVILACGSYAGCKKGQLQAGYEYAKAFGHTILPVLPSLVQVRCKESFFHGIAGVRCDAELSLYEKEQLLSQERGELQLTDYGISGIVVFQLSHIISKKLAINRPLRVTIDFLPDYEKEEWKQFVSTRILLKSGESVEDFFLGLLHKKLCALVMRQAGLSPTAIVGKENEGILMKACEAMKCFAVTPKEVNPYENAQVCTGGVDFSQLSDELESCFTKNLYFCGEMIDVDGKCGGYNLQWAWTSGYIAGKAAAQEGQAGK